MTNKSKNDEAREVRHMLGPPPKFQSVEEMQEKIDAYFESCEGHVLCTEEEGPNGQITKKPVLNKYGEPVIVGERPLTVTGLANALGFESRTSLFRYQGKKEFREVIVRAKSRIEQYTEERLFDKEGANGAKFSLQNNFRDWNEALKEAAKSSTPAITIIADIPRPDPVTEDEANDEEAESGS